MRYLYRYFVSFHRAGKVVNMEFCNSMSDVQLLRAMARLKGCECEVFDLHKNEKTFAETKQEHNKEQASFSMGRKWCLKCKCLETGKVYASISDCSKDTGIPHKSIYNAVISGNPRNGLHFIRMEIMEGNKEKYSRTNENKKAQND